MRFAFFFFSFFFIPVIALYLQLRILLSKIKPAFYLLPLFFLFFYMSMKKCFVRRPRLLLLCFSLPNNCVKKVVSHVLFRCISLQAVLTLKAVAADMLVLQYLHIYAFFFFGFIILFSQL